MHAFMNRRIRRWLSILLLGALAFSQASLVLAACAMDRGGLAQMLSTPADHECCDEGTAPQGGNVMPMSANLCASHVTFDLQAFNAFSGALIARAPGLSLAPPRPQDAASAPRQDAPPKAVPRRILLHSFLI